MGVRLTKELLAAAGEALKVNMTTLGPLVLPISEQVLFIVNLIVRKVRATWPEGGGGGLWEGAARRQVQHPARVRRVHGHAGCVPRTAGWCARSSPGRAPAPAGLPAQGQALHPGLQPRVRQDLHPHRRARGHRRDREAAAPVRGDGGAVARGAVPLRQHLLLLHLVGTVCCAVGARAWGARTDSSRTSPARAVRHTFPLHQGEGAPCGACTHVHAAAPCALTHLLRQPACTVRGHAWWHVASDCALGWPQVRAVIHGDVWGGAPGGPDLAVGLWVGLQVQQRGVARQAPHQAGARRVGWLQREGCVRAGCRGALPQGGCTGRAGVMLARARHHTSC